MCNQKNDPIVNSNSQNFIHNSSQPKQVFRIQPDKFTFLKSNLLVSNIINKNHSKQKKNISIKNIQQADAYVNCQFQMNKLQEQNDIKRAKIQRVKNLAKCRSQMTFDQFVLQQKIINQKIQNVYILRKQMVEKAAQIMGKKEDNSYLGRNLLKNQQNLLKELKQNNPSDKIHKTQTVRLLMKQNAKKCNRKQFKQLLQDSANLSFTKQLNGSSLNNSLQLSLLDITNVKAVEQKIHNDSVLRKLIKNKSTDNFMQEQKRRAVWEGFSQHWRKGSEKQQQSTKQLKKKRNKKPMRPRFQTSDHEILNYNDHYTRHFAMKNYSNAFAQTANTYKLGISSSK